MENYKTQIKEVKYKVNGVILVHGFEAVLMCQFNFFLNL